MNPTQQKDAIRTMLLPRIDDKLRQIADKDAVEEKQQCVDLLLRRRHNLMLKLEE